MLQPAEVAVSKNPSTRSRDENTTPCRSTTLHKKTGMLKERQLHFTEELPNEGRKEVGWGHGVEPPYLARAGRFRSCCSSSPSRLLFPLLFIELFPSIYLFCLSIPSRSAEHKIDTPITFLGSNPRTLTNPHTNPKSKSKNNPNHTPRGSDSQNWQTADSASIPTLEHPTAENQSRNPQISLLLRDSRSQLTPLSHSAYRERGVSEPKHFKSTREARTINPTGQQDDLPASAPLIEP